METNQTQNQNEINWMDAEIANLNETEKKDLTPAIKFEENKLYEIEIDFSQAWEKWTDPVSKVIKKIIPIVYNGQKAVFFLNVANPIYGELLKKGKSGQKKFKVIRIGQAKATRYKLVD